MFKRNSEIKYSYKTKTIENCYSLFSLSLIGQNNVQERRTVTAITDSCGGRCTDARRIKYMNKQTHGSTIKDYYGSTCTDAQGSTCTDVSTDSTVVYTDSTGVYRSPFPYIYTKGMGLHGGMSKDVFTGRTVLRGRTCVYDEYGMHGPIRLSIEPVWKHVSTDAVGKVQKGFSYNDTLYQGTQVQMKLQS